MTPFQSSPQASLNDFFRRNAGLIAGAGLFVTFWMLVYTFAVYKPQYMSKSVVIIRDSAITGRYIESEKYYALQTTSSSSSNPVLNTMGILKAASISDKLLNYFQSKHPEELKKNKIKTKKQWESFYQDGSAFIKAKNQPGTDLIAIQFSWSDPVIAKEALNVVVKSFQEASRDLNKEEQISRTRFLNKQVIEIESQLTAIRNHKSKYQSEQHTVSVKREGDDLAGSRMELSNKLNQVESQALGKENQVRRYQQLLGMDAAKALRASAIGQNSSLTKLQDELYHLQQQYSLLSASLTDSNPKVLEIQAQISQVKANIQAEKARTIGRQASANTNGGEIGIVADGTRNTLINEMLKAYGETQDLRSQAASMRNRLNQINRDIRTFPGMAEGLANIEQKEASLSVALDQLREKVLEGKLKEEQTLSNVFIVDAPRLPEKAQFPNRNHLIVLSVLLGFGVGVASAFAKEQFTSGNQYALPEWLKPIDADGQNSDDSDEGPNDDHNANPPHRNLESKALFPVATHTIPPAIQRPVEPMILPHEPITDRRDVPIMGSLFDSLAPLAGSVTPKPTNHATEFRRDLTRPLPKQSSVPTFPEASSIVQHPVQSIDLAPASIALPVYIQDMDLLPPDLEPPSVSKSVKLAQPIDLAQVARLHGRTGFQPSISAGDIPVTYTTPAPSLSTLPLTEQDEQSAATDEPIAIAIAPSSEEEEPSAQAAYEAQAKAMPLPRKRRGIPSFLLEDEPKKEEAPYVLVPKKQLLSVDDNLMQEVAPLAAPAKLHLVSLPPEFPTSSVSNNDLQESFAADTEPPMKSAVPDFLLDQAAPVIPRKPLLNGRLFGEKPARHPEVYFGLESRSGKQKEIPGSLSRLMQSGKYD